MPYIRKATENDAPVVISLVTKLLSELRGHAWTGDEKALIEKTHYLLKNDICIAYLINIENREIGIITISSCQAIRTEGEYGIIQELYIEPEYRCGGYGKELLAKAKNLARAKKWPRLEVGVPSLPQWSRTLTFYEKHGFVQIGPRLKWLDK